MIYVRIEKWPRGNRAAAEVLREAIIVNDGTGGPGVGNYDVALSKPGGFGARSRLTLGQACHVWRRGRVENFARKALGAFELVYRALGAALPTGAQTKCSGEEG